MPALAVFGWEGIHFLLPPLLKQISVIHYLQSLCPVPVSEGPLAILSDAPAPWVSVLGLSPWPLVLVAVSAWKIRRMEIGVRRVRSRPLRPETSPLPPLPSPSPDRERGTRLERWCL